MNTIQGSLTIINPHAPDAKVFWNGQEVSVTGISIQNDDVAKSLVTLTVAEDPILAELKAAGIRIVRA